MTTQESIAWCPDCGDEIFREQKRLKAYENWTYYCIGCDKYFQLTEVKAIKEASKVEK